MPANHLDGRYGLASYADTNTYLHKDDVNQMVLRALAVGDVFASLMGGEGIYSGGASVIGSITSGTTYPAFMGMMKDDGNAWWFFHPAAGTLMDFLVASGACTAYLVPTSVDGVSPSMAVGGLADFMILVQLTATAAPAHSIPLGSGNVTASAFTTWVVDPAIMVAANASIYAQRAKAETISGAWTHTGYWISTNGKRRTVRDAKFGPPTGGSYAVGDEWVDLAGARWRYVGSAWVQETPGVATVWSGGGAGDITATGQWNGAALLTGYRVFDGTREWMYDTTGSLNRWRAMRPTRTVFPYYLAASSLMTATLAAAYTMPMPVGDSVVKEWGVLFAPASGSGIDGSNYWTADLKPGGGTSLQTLTKNTNSQTMGQWQPAIAATNIYTGNRIDVDFTKTGAPPNIYVPSYLETYDLR